MPSNGQLLQYLATGVTNDESQVDLRELAEMLLADCVASEVESNDEFHLLRKEFMRPQQDICKLFINAVEEAGIDIDTELLAIERDVIAMIIAIDSKLENGFTFAKMWKTDRKAACREILRSVGHGVSFWDDYAPEDFGQPDCPDVGLFESPHSECYEILTKFVAYIHQQLV